MTSTPRPPTEIRETSSTESRHEEGHAHLHEAANEKNPPPAAEKSEIHITRKQNLFLVFITLTQLVQMMPLGVGINSGLAIGAALGASRIESAWVVASYPLTQGSVVLMGGRLGTVYGHRNVLSVGCMWWVVWALAGGFSNNLIAVCVMRALCGIGGGLMIPNIIALIGIEFPPGKKRNLGFALFGAMAPVGAVGGSLVGAIVIQLTEWKWAFLLMGLLGCVVYGVAIASADADIPMDPHGTVDWPGAYFGVSGLVLFNFVWNQAPVVGWSNPYEITLLVISVIHFALFVFWETRVAQDPILPFNIWGAPSFGRLILVVGFSFMSLGIYFWYMNIYMQTIRGDTLIQTGLQYLPLTIAGSLVPFLAAWMIPRLPAQIIIGIGTFAMVTINVLLATLPEKLTYWAMCFPAMFISAFTIDLITTSSQIIVSNTVPMRHQGVAGSLIGTLLGYGMSTGLGFAGTVEVNTFENGANILRGYHSAAYLAIGLSGTAFLLTFFIRIPKDTRNGWSEDDAEATERQATRGQVA